MDERSDLVRALELVYLVGDPTSTGRNPGLRSWHRRGSHRIRQPVRVWIAARAQSDDIDSWLEVVSGVEPLFGPMPDFEATLIRKVGRGEAWCVRDSRAVLGGLLLASAVSPRIDWLAVRSSARGQGVGRALVAEALHQYSGAPEVVVDTFGEDNRAGRPARRLYESFGFEAAEHLESGAEGGTRQRFRLIIR